MIFRGCEIVPISFPNVSVRGSARALQQGPQGGSSQYTGNRCDTTDDKAAILVSGIATGLAGGFVEELGWTGFAIPRLTARYGVLGTGLIVGPAWGAWHLLQMWWVGGTSSEALPLALFLPLFFLSAVAILTAYRVLMVWVYDRTGSLLVAVLMHASYIFSTLFVFAPPTTGAPFLTYSGVFAVALWVVVAVVVCTNPGSPRQPSTSRGPSRAV